MFPHLRGSAAGPVRRAHGDVDAGRRLCIGGVASLCSRQPRDNQTAGETPLPKQQAEGGRRRGDLGRGGISENPNYVLMIQQGSEPVEVNNKLESSECDGGL